MLKFISKEIAPNQKPRVYRMTDDLARRLSLCKRRANKKSYNDLFEVMIGLAEQQIEKELKEKKK